MDEAIGAEIRRLRQTMGLSQYDLAARMNVSQPQVIQYEKGRDQTSLAALFDLEESFGLERGHFFAVALDAVNQAESDFFSTTPKNASAP